MHPDAPDAQRLRFNEAVVLAPLPEARQKAIYRQLLRANPARRVELAKNLAAEANGVVRARKQVNMKKTTDRFIARVSAEVDRMLDYRQSDFRKALSQVDAAELKRFRANLSYLLAEIDGARK
jgi:hypothetical protein